MSLFRILIVEDEATLLRGLTRLLDWEALGCCVCGGAANGREGLQKMAECCPHIVLTDLRMPVMDGLEMLRASKAAYGYEAVILSGYSDFQYARQALSMGVADYLLKPVDPQELSQVILGLVKKLKEQGVGAQEQSLYTQRAMQYIALHYGRRMGAAHIAGELLVSPDYLNKIFKRDTGQTLHEYLTRYRIAQACRLLQEHPDWKVYQVAQQVGYGDYKYFHNVFAKIVGCPPTDFRP